MLVNAKEFDPERVNVTGPTDSAAHAFFKSYMSSIGGWPVEAVGKSMEWLKKHLKKVGVHAATQLPKADFEENLGEGFWDPELQK